MCDVEFGIKAARERERQSRMMRNTNDRRYELETEENIKYMLSNNFMFFFFLFIVKFVVSSIGAHYRVSGKIWLRCIENHNFCFFLLIGRVCDSGRILCHIRNACGSFSYDIGACWMLILVIEQQNLLSSNALTSTRLNLWTTGTIRMLWELDGTEHRHHCQHNEQVQNTHQHASSTRIRSTAKQPHNAFCIILEMNSTSIKQWST